MGIWNDTRILQCERRRGICAEDDIGQAQDENEEFSEDGQVGEDHYESRECVLSKSSYKRCEKCDNPFVLKNVFDKHLRSCRGVQFH